MFRRGGTVAWSSTGLTTATIAAGPSLCAPSSWNPIRRPVNQPPGPRQASSLETGVYQKPKSYRAKFHDSPDRLEERIRQHKGHQLTYTTDIKEDKLGEMPKDYDGKDKLEGEMHDYELDNNLGVARHIGSQKRFHQFYNQPIPPPSLLAVYFDGMCPVCKKEITLLKSWDAHRNRIKFYDCNQMSDTKIAIELPGVNGGIKELLSSMHSKDLTTGAVLKGMSTFRRLYGLIGERNIEYLAPKEPSEEQKRQHGGADAPTLQLNNTTEMVSKKLKLPNPPLLATALMYFFKFTGWPLVRPFADLAYVKWAKARFRIEGKGGKIVDSCDHGCVQRPRR